MPRINEVRRGKEIGFKSKSNKFIWLACIDCGKERWVLLRIAKPDSSRCQPCENQRPRLHRRGENSHTWKGGKWTDKKGYVYILVQPENFFYPMVGNHRYVLEHRLVMARHLGRCLQSWEIVHHKGIRYSGIENRSDNLMDNLELSCSLGEHSLNHSKGYKDGYRKGYSDGLKKAMEKTGITSRW